MKDLSIDVRPYRLRFNAPFVTAAGTHTAREGFLVRVAIGDGVAGWGEAAPLAGHGGESHVRCRSALAELSARLQEWHGAGESVVPDTLEALGSLMDRLAPHAPDAPAARAGIDLALADLAARLAGLPLSRWLSPAARDTVPVNATVGALPPERSAARARDLVRAGFGTLKVKLGLNDVIDVERIARVRDVVGSRVALRIDANGAWNPLRAEVMLEALWPSRIEYVEQPLPADQIAEAAELRRTTRVPIAADESLLLPDGVARVLAGAAADVLVLKPSLAGGLAATWSAAAAARRVGVAVVVTTSLDSAVGRLGALHLAAALPGVDRACGLVTGGMLAEDVARSAEPEGGRMVVPSAAGLGIEPVVP